MSYLTFLRVNARWLAAAFLMTFSSSYGQTFFISIFASEIRTEFSLSNGAWGGIYTLGTSMSAVAMIWGGVLTDIFRVRVLGPLFLALLSIACIAMSLLPSVLVLVFVIFALRFTGQGMSSHIGMVATARWFVATRGRAMSIASMGFSIGNAILPIVFVALLSVASWRSLWVLAAVMSAAAIPVLIFLLQHERTPKSISESSQSTGMFARHWTRSEILRHWLFWLMVPTLLGPSAWGTSLFFQQVHIAEVKGWTQLEFVSLFPIYIIASTAMTITIGWVIDRLGTNRILPFYLLPFIAGFLVIGWAQSLPMAAVAW